MGEGYEEPGLPRNELGRAEFQLESLNKGWMLGSSWMNIPGGSWGLPTGW